MTHLRIGISLPVRELKDDLGAIREFAQAADELGFAHLRVPDQVIRPRSGHLHEPMTLLAWVAGITRQIELVPSVIVLPSRQTALFAKQAAEIDILSGGRLRLGIGVGGSREEYAALGHDYRSRGRRCDEQLELLERLFTDTAPRFQGEFESLDGFGLDPLPIQRPIPIWIGGGAGLMKEETREPILRRIGRYADGWFAIVPIDDVAALRERIRQHAEAAGRDANTIGLEGGCGMAGKTTEEWLARLRDWNAAGASHLCLRTLDGDLAAAAQLHLMREARRILDLEGIACA
ncbi:MAG: TIGR03619 family F420-dependent LLM class oxidoreductase [Deltaproteobacteria bacterium]|jgi:probable F420-dependent oxidoreductase|nr:TIGR03619 family F420-dependent LLM class oxidoreductase [Deltaproteobacteria bacterium]MBW2500515.1 TIGR03619 family F420-dependent LLM class oxidoreductase [Deltaproteobacteria bacterium]